MVPHPRPLAREQAGLSWETVLKKREGYGAAFARSTICYAFMQAIGMVNDHVVGCYRYQEV